MFFFVENLVCISVATLECTPLYFFFLKRKPFWDTTTSSSGESDTKRGGKATLLVLFERGNVDKG